MNSYLSNSSKTPLIFLKGLEDLSQLKGAVEYFKSPSAEFIVVEPSLKRYNALKVREEAGRWLAHPKVHWWVNRSSDEFFAEAYDFLRVPSRLFHMKAAIFLDGANLTADDQSYFERVEDEWLACQKQRIRSLGGIEDSKMGFRNVIQNKSFIQNHPGINLLKNQFKDLPAIIISTGPSLKKSLDDLKSLQNRAVLIAADASLKVLCDAGIKPHFVCSIERDEAPKLFFEKIKDVSSHLVAYPLVPHTVLSAYQGPQWVAYRDYGYFYFLEKELPRGILSSSSSVAHMGLRLAMYLGASKIALVGQDLAYDPQTLQSHPSGVAFEEWSQSRSFEEIRERAAKENLGDVFWTEGNDGKDVPTNSVYFSFMKEFSWEATQTKIPITNCTSGGARIPNIESSTLQKWSSQDLNTIDIFDRIQKLRENFESKDMHFQEIREFLEQLHSKWSQVIPLIDSLSTAHLSSDARFEIFKDLRASEKKLLEDVRYITIIIQNAGREYLERVNDLELLEIQSSIDRNEYQKQVTDLYKIIAHVTRELLSCF